MVAQLDPMLAMSHNEQVHKHTVDNTNDDEIPTEPQKHWPCRSSCIHMLLELTLATPPAQQVLGLGGYTPLVPTTAAGAASRRRRTDDATDVGRLVVERETLGHVTQVQRLDVEDVLDVTRVGGVRAHEALIG